MSDCRNAEHPKTHYSRLLRQSSRAPIAIQNQPNYQKLDPASLHEPVPAVEALESCGAQMENSLSGACRRAASLPHQLLDRGLSACHSSRKILITSRRNHPTMQLLLILLCQVWPDLDRPRGRFVVSSPRSPCESCRPCLLFSATAVALRLPGDRVIRAIRQRACRACEAISCTRTPSMAGGRTRPARLLAGAHSSVGSSVFTSRGGFFFIRQLFGPSN